MKTCLKTGSTATALGPTGAVVGRHVAPAEEPLPFFGDDRARTAAWIASRVAGVARQEDQAGAVLARPAAAAPGATLRRNVSGIWTRMPAPSPVLTSQPHAPRCCRFISTWSACATIACDFRPLMSTTKPTPQASCSCCGS